MGFSCPHCAQSIEDVIPKDRFDQVNTKKNEAETALAAKAAELEAARAGATDVDTVRAELDCVRAELDSTTIGHEAYKAITGAGIAPEVVDGFLDSYTKMGDERPATIGEWVNGMREGTMAPPALLAPHLPSNGQPDGAAAPAAGTPASPAAPAPGAAPPAPANATPPPANAGAHPHPHAPDPYDASAIARMSPMEFKAYKTQQGGTS